MTADKPDQDIVEGMARYAGEMEAKAGEATRTWEAAKMEVVRAENWVERAKALAARAEARAMVAKTLVLAWREGGTSTRKK